RAQLAHIEQTSRQALADVRATSSGMRTVRAATEIASARSVLASVGIEAEVPTALPALDDHRAELFGYVIREGVTNIVRHSGAHTATVTVTEDRVRISDDGEGIPAGTTRTGLAGLARRVAEAGGAPARRELRGGHRPHRRDARPGRTGRARRVDRTGGAPMIRVVVADDQSILRSGLTALLRLESDLEVVAEAADGAGTLRAV